ncbi:alpha/beta fold hydrolase [Pseudonocardia xinjiangensis]|uniref:alpha/beta fold hydrolase n=1 Tax=Pseudonocardia xinjiangensis TaxID=75289 RepID=UPI003D8D4712
MTEVGLPDGRTLEYVTVGPADGVPLVLHHGTPSAAVVFEPWAEAAAKHGFRLVMYSRPGYAGSSPRPGRTVADAAGDVAAVLDALGARRFVTVGWSGGGPHALACARLLPDRCAAAALIAGVGPYGVIGLDFLSGMGTENLEEFGAALEGEVALTSYLNEQGPAFATAQAAALGAALGDLVSGIDRAQLTGEFADYLAESFRAALRSGIEGWRDDDLAFVTGWGFGLGDGRVPVAIWQGGEDRMVPYAHGRWLAEHVAGAEAHLSPEEGHLSLVVGGFEGIVADLARLAG